MESKIDIKYLDKYTPPDFQVEHISLEFDIRETYTRVTSLMTISRVDPSNQSPLRLDGVDLQLETIHMDGEELPRTAFRLFPDAMVIQTVPDAFTLKIVNRIYPDKNTQLVGLYKTGEQYCTQCEAEGFRRITWFFDRPDAMTTWEARIIADKTRFPVLLSNGNPVDSGELEGNRHWALWVDPYKKPAYLFALVAGKFDMREDIFRTRSGRDVTLRIYVEPGDLNKSAHAMQSLKKAMTWDEEIWHREYDLNLFMIVAVRDFNAGAMENKGLNIFNSWAILAEPDIATDDDYLLIESVIAHEYFHNWTGNRITLRDWFQLSLKEGLTIFREQSFTEDTFSEAVSRIRTVTHLRTRQFPEDAGPLAHAVQPRSYMEISNFYSTTIYAKGAEIVRMLKTLLGDELFYKGMEWYFNEYDGKAITTDDFVHAFEVVSGRNLSQFKLWYTQCGTPILHITDSWDPASKTWSLHIKQDNMPSASQLMKLPMVIPLAIALFDDQGNPLRLSMNGQDMGLQMVLPITFPWQTFIFDKINVKPVPSLLRGFSAPVKLNYAWTDAQLQTLFTHDTDSFNQWEAGQIQSHKILKKLITQVQRKEKLIVPEQYIQSFNDLLKTVLNTKGNDKYFTAEMMTLPGEKLLGEKMDIIDFHAIHAAREYLLKAIANATQENLLAIYQETHRKSLENCRDFSMEAIASRRLKNLCLFYLMTLNKPEYIALAETQFETALDCSMTDTLGALRCLVNVDSQVQQRALSAFYEKWKHVPQVVDKWLVQQALSKLPDTLERVKNLSQNPIFNLKNPNQVHALIGTFTQQNFHCFHDINGRGYKFLRETVLRLNQQNPILAAAMVKPLLDLQRYDKRRQAIIRDEIKTILNTDNLSRALYEVVKASLS